MRLGSAGDPLRWQSSHPAKCGPLTSHLSRFPSAVRMNAPLRVPTRARTLLMTRLLSFRSIDDWALPQDEETHRILSKLREESNRRCSNAEIQYIQSEN